MPRPLDPFVVESPEPGDIQDPRLQALLRYWECRRGTADAPPIAAIDPVEFRFILGWLMIMEPLEGGRDFRYRLYGTCIADAFGRDLTGRNIGDSFPEVANLAITVYRRVMERRCAVLTRHTPPESIPIERWERLALPFLDSKGDVTRLLVGAIAQGVRRTDRAPPPWPLGGQPGGGNNDS
ncbi:MAG TPA: PAS domain-containing protein [Stellaceae bacterium]|nr:PAS domain-containing protein [Stellaceae bacterium]